MHERQGHSIWQHRWNRPGQITLRVRQISCGIICGEVGEVLDR